MKKYLLVLFALIFLTGTSCKEKIDIEKEKEAIKAVFEQEKAGFFSQNFATMAETWIQEPSSVKVYMYPEGQRKYEGWDAISQQDQKNVADTTWDRKSVNLTFRNFQINLLEDEAAWVMCEALWEGVYQGNPMNIVQTRINILKKNDGKWKYALMAIYNQPQENKQ
jgi:hypothetical protein